MNCKHLKVEGYTTKYYFCKAKNKAINTFECRDCLLKINGAKNIVEELFGTLKKKRRD